MNARSLLAAWAVLVAAVLGAHGCDGEVPSYAYGEPIRVRGGQFFTGDLPGTPPGPDADNPDAGTPQSARGQLALTSLTLLNPVVYSGEAGKQLGGRTTDNTGAIALRFADLGSGYWVVPVGGPDPQYPGELGWSVVCDFGRDITAGSHPLRIVPIAADGHAGTQTEQKMCLASSIPDNLHACSNRITSPEAVISLQWDVDADLDLHVITPSGRDVDPKHPLVNAVDAGVAPGPGTPSIDRDSLAACVPDARRQEDLVFPTRPTGSWSIYANLFNACGQSAVTFELKVFEASGEGTDRQLKETLHRSGRLLASDANGGAAPGLFIVEYPFD